MMSSTASEDTEQGNIFAVRYTADTQKCPKDRDAARRIVRHCDALYETFLRGVRCVVHEGSSLFSENSNAKLLLAEDGGDKICGDVCMSIVREEKL